MRYCLTILALVVAAPVFADDLRLNQIQVIGSHNSYHIAPTADTLALIAAARKDGATSLDYTHRTLAEQFEKLGIRQVELDVFADPAGGLFAKPSAYGLLKERGKDPGPDPNIEGQLAKPGFKVLHLPDIDYRSTVPTFAAGLKQIREWSKAHPRHVPILVLVELKEDAIALLPTKPVKFDAKLLDAIDAEIRAVFDKDAMFAPDDLRGTLETLPEAIRKRGWPTLADSRGKVLFALDNDGKLPLLYLENHQALKGRAMFILAENPTDPAAAFFKLNEPIKDFDRIRKLVAEGFLVRTRADADTKEARANDTNRRDKALASGAQYVSTDFPEPRAEWSNYQVRLPGNVIARVNPVSGPPKGGADDVELRK